MNTEFSSTSEEVLAAPAKVLDKAVSVRLLRGAGRRLKPAAALTILFAGAFGILSEQSTITANSAVISTRVVSVRTPIEGLFSAAALKANQPVQRGVSLGAVANNRFDPQAQELYQQQAIESTTQAAALGAEERTLRAQRAELLSRVRAHTEALTGRMDRVETEAEGALTARQAGFKLASADLERGKQLFDLGIVSRAALDKLDADAAVAQAELRGEESALAATRSEGAAVRHGMMIEAGNNNDVAYSEQRIDEIDLRLADLERERLNAEAAAVAAQGSYTQALEHNQAMGSAALVAPASGMLWKWFAVDGERVGVGDKVAELVDCQSAFLLAALPQDRVPAIAIGSSARYRLSGESVEHLARVASINAELPTLEGNKLAAEPIKVDDRPAVLVRLDLDPKDEAKGCLVGRTASVVIQAHQHDAIATLFHHYF